MITIVDYGLGNIAAFLNVYKRLNIEATVARSEDDILRATHLILPGVGSFDHAMQRLDATGMCDALTDQVVAHEVPVLGVCVGMQMLASTSDEGQEKGLGWIDGSVKRMQPIELSAKLPLPHMGWNDVEPVAGNSLFKGLETGARFYFLHSYHLQCDRSADIGASTIYGIEFSCAVRKRNIYGVQFHPEKSHQFGSRLLKNFAEL